MDTAMDTAKNLVKKRGHRTDRSNRGAVHPGGLAGRIADDETEVTTLVTRWQRTHRRYRWVSWTNYTRVAPVLSGLWPPRTHSIGRTTPMMPWHGPWNR
jgi:hypothetical protein